MKLRNLFRRRRRVEIAISQAIPEEELVEKFAYPGHPLLDGMMRALDNEVASLINTAMDHELPDKETDQALGGINALMVYKARVEDYVVEALEKANASSR
jgi:hypothetical protein